MVDAKLACPEALQVNYSLPICRGTVQGETPEVQPLQCLSQLHRTLSPKVAAFLMKLTSHGGAEQDYKGSVIST